MEWEPIMVWRAIGPDGEVWAEASDEKDVRRRARADDVVQQLHRRTQFEWRPQPAFGPRR